MEPVYTYHSKEVSIYSLGGFVQYDPGAKNNQLFSVHQRIAEFLRLLPENERPERVVWQRLPGKRHPEAARSSAVIDHRFLDHLAGGHANRSWIVMNGYPADAAVLLVSKVAVTLTSRDCPYLVLWCDVGDRVAVAVCHCGREELFGKNEESVVLNMMNVISTYGVIRPIGGLITLGIAPEHFNNERYPDLVNSIAKRWGNEVITDKDRLTLDLKEIVLRQLISCGVPRECIAHDELDTYTDTRLASMRAGRNGLNHNMVIAHLRA